MFLGRPCADQRTVSFIDSLKNHGADTETNEMFRMGEETMRLPLEEKLRFEQGDDGVSFGYVLVTFLYTP